MPTPIWNGPTSTAVNAANAPAIVQTNVDIRFGAHPGQRGGVGVRGRRTDRAAVAGPSEEQREQQRDERYHREHDDVLAATRSPPP